MMSLFPHRLLPLHLPARVGEAAGAVAERLLLRRPPLVRLTDGTDRIAMLRSYEIGELGGWVCIDLGQPADPALTRRLPRAEQRARRRQWLPADHVTLIHPGH